MSEQEPSRILNIAITGAAGLVGTAVVQHALSQGHTVLALDLPPSGSIPLQERYTYQKCDLLDYDDFENKVKEGGCNAIIHLAATFNLRDEFGNKLDGVNQHNIHNKNVSMNYNALNIAWRLGINDIVLASSVNAIGMIGSKRPRFDYLPLDEKHPFYPEAAYDLGKYIVEIHSDAFVRRTPSMRIASLRFHAVTPIEECTPERLHKKVGYWKDLWGWVSVSATAEACLLGLTAPESTFPRGSHEAFFIVADTTMVQGDSYDLLRSEFGKEELPDETLRREFKGGNRGFFDTGKARRMLGWNERGFEWKP